MNFPLFAVLATFFFFETSAFSSRVRTLSSVRMRMGYLDDLSSDLNAPDPNPVPEEESREANVMSKDDIDRAGPGSWESYVEFNEVRKECLPYKAKHYCPRRAEAYTYIWFLFVLLMHNSSTEETDRWVLPVTVRKDWINSTCQS